jgi:hypothetical protein
MVEDVLNGSSAFGKWICAASVLFDSRLSTILLARIELIVGTLSRSLPTTHPISF